MKQKIDKNVSHLIPEAKVILHFCVIIMMMSGVALAADRNVIVVFHKPVGQLEKDLIKINNGTDKKDFHIIGAISAKLPVDKIAKLSKDPRIKYIVNDTNFTMADEYTSSWGVAYIGSQPVHNKNIKGSGVKIGVLDTGIDYTHPDLKDNYKGGFNFVNNNSDPWDDNCLDYYKTCHGTHISGTIVAELNGFGVVGVAPEAGIYAIKVLDGGGFGTASTILSGIEWAMNNNMNIISMSLESTENNSAVLDAINVAYNSGILLVAAGGNTGGGPVLYPAAYDSVIAVTAIDQNAQRAIFSPIDPKIEVAAPGVNINSTVCISGINHCLQEGYGPRSGTSMAVPHVTGEAALIYSTNFPDVNGDGKRDNKDVRQIIDNTAFHPGIPGRDNIYGYGIVDSQNAILGIPTFRYPAIINFAPVSPINNLVGDSRNFNITIDQVANVTWFMNGTQIQSNESVTDATYANTNAILGTWNVRATASNIYGSVTYTWIWTVISYTITPSVASVTVDSPNGGEIWSRGTTQIIRWETGNNTEVHGNNTGAHVKIELLGGTKVVSTIAKNAKNSGSYTWKISKGQSPAANYKIRVTSTNNSLDTSNNYFTIK